MTFDEAVAIVRPLTEQKRRHDAMLAAMKAARDQTSAVQHSQETRLNDIYDILDAAIEEAEGRS